MKRLNIVLFFLFSFCLVVFAPKAAFGQFTEYEDSIPNDAERTTETVRIPANSRNETVSFNGQRAENVTATTLKDCYCLSKGPNKYPIAAHDASFAAANGYKFRYQTRYRESLTELTLSSGTYRSNIPDLCQDTTLLMKNEYEGMVVETYGVNQGRIVRVEGGGQIVKFSRAQPVPGLQSSNTAQAYGPPSPQPRRNARHDQTDQDGQEGGEYVVRNRTNESGKTTVYVDFEKNRGRRALNENAVIEQIRRVIEKVNPNLTVTYIRDEADQILLITKFEYTTVSQYVQLDRNRQNNRRIDQSYNTGIGELGRIRGAKGRGIRAGATIGGGVLVDKVKQVPSYRQDNVTIGFTVRLSDTQSKAVLREKPAYQAFVYYTPDLPSGGRDLKQLEANVPSDSLESDGLSPDSNLVEEQRISLVAIGYEIKQLFDSRTSVDRDSSDQHNRNTEKRRRR